MVMMIIMTKNDPHASKIWGSLLAPSDYYAESSYVICSWKSGDKGSKLKGKNMSHSVPMVNRELPVWTVTVSYRHPVISESLPIPSPDCRWI